MINEIHISDFKRMHSLDVYHKYFPDKKVIRIVPGRNYYSPFRSENNPSFNIFRNGKEEYLWKDFGTGDSGDAIGYVMKLFSIEFPDTIKKLNNDFNLQIISDKLDAQSKASARTNISDPKITRNYDYTLEESQFTVEALSYFDDYKISRDVLIRYNVGFINRYTAYYKQGQQYSVNRDERQLLFAFKEEAFAKIYCPDPKKFIYVGKKPADYVFGFTQLDEEGAHVFITSGEKDVMTLAGQGVNAISMNSETAYVPRNLIDELKKRFKVITVLYDNDKTGKLNAEKICKRYGLRMAILPEKLSEFGGKDVSDLIKFGLSFNDITYEEYQATVSKNGLENTKDIDGDDKNYFKAVLESSELIEKYFNYEINFILDPLIFENGINMVGAERGTGKTRFCITLGMSIVYGEKSFLGYNICNHGNVLMLNYEMLEPEFKLFVSPIENHYQNKANKVFEFHTLSLISHPEISIQYLSKIIGNYNPKIIIIDSFKAFMSRILQETKQRDLNNQSISYLYKILHAWRRDFNSTMLITNHTNKGTSNMKSHSDLMFGPGAVFDYADHTFLLRKTKEPNQRLLIPDKSRFSPDGSTSNILFEIKSDETNKMLWLNLLESDVNEGDYLISDRRHNTKNDVEQVRPLFIKSFTQREIAKVTGFSVGKVNRLVNLLKEEDEK
ncbi:AAA family ATPase [Candidatus Babeliales bacterium]|nr:AAA family ATPase [Candidatus Babeliales bacterium]